MRARTINDFNNWVNAVQIITDDDDVNMDDCRQCFERGETPAEYVDLRYNQGLSPMQVRWCKAHDWYVTHQQIPNTAHNPQFEVKTKWVTTHRDPATQEIITHESEHWMRDFQAIRRWAGY